MFKFTGIGMRNEWSRELDLDIKIDAIQREVDGYKDWIKESGDPYGVLTKTLNKYSEELERLKDKKKALSK